VRIVEETKRAPRRALRPINGTLHPWSDGEGRPIGLYVAADAAKAVERMVAAGAKADVESMGLLLGDAFVDEHDLPFAVAGALVTAPLQATRTHVRFNPNRFIELAREMESVAFEHLIVGWVHTHLGAGVRLSPVDHATQRRYFGAPHQVTWVLDPVDRRSGATRLQGDTKVEVDVFILRASASGLPDFLRARERRSPGTRAPNTSR
jgi:proteasome lid subunit RPN8/RPN11